MEVNPEKQNIDALFSRNNYYIDFYQREYKWGDDTVRRLIDDVFYQFEQAYARCAALDPTPENITGRYGWYYLNTYITNTSDGRIFVVDGQQRLTTLTLMLIALRRMAQEVFPSPGLTDWLTVKLVGIGIGGKKRFWMAHEKREPLMAALLDDAPVDSSVMDDDITAQHMIDNFRIIGDELAKRLTTQHKFESFVHYFLLKVVIINLDVSQADVAMVFEVINDRGVRLLPYEIMKGKLLGQIDKQDVDRYADIWDQSLHAMEARKDTLVDEFFRTYFRAWYCTNRKQSERFDGDYHRQVFSEELGQALHLQRDPMGVKQFLTGPFRYYSSLFMRLQKLADSAESAEAPECYYSSQLNFMDGYMMLALAACSIDDPEETAKIAAVARSYDRAYVMLQLNRAYDSNQFQELLYKLSAVLHSCPVEQIDATIDAEVLKEINERRNASNTALLSYEQFRRVGYGDYNTRFLRYLLTRVEMFVAHGLGKALQDTPWNYVRGVGKGTAYHVEHILARNDASRALFTNSDGKHDEAAFEDERNRFGGLLLLKGQDNQSSGAEGYADKLRTYIGKAPYWAQTLAPDFYKAHSAMASFCADTGLPFQPIPDFDRNALEARSRLMFAIVSRIWRLAGPPSPDAGAVG